MPTDSGTGTRILAQLTGGNKTVQQLLDNITVPSGKKTTRHQLKHWLEYMLTKGTVSKTSSTAKWHIATWVKEQTMPSRKKENFKEHNGKFKYISKNYQRDFNIKDDDLEVATNVEIEQGENVSIPSKVELNKDDFPQEVKNKRRELIKKNHPDRGGNEDELKKVLDEYGD